MIFLSWNCKHAFAFSVCARLAMIRMNNCRRFYLFFNLFPLSMRILNSDFYCWKFDSYEKVWDSVTSFNRSIQRAHLSWYSILLRNTFTFYFSYSLIHLFIYIIHRQPRKTIDVTDNIISCNTKPKFIERQLKRKNVSRSVIEIGSDSSIQLEIRYDMNGKIMWNVVRCNNSENSHDI